MTATNRFAALLQRAMDERWCTDPRCTTCGASGFRDGLRELGPGLADDLAGADLDRLQRFADWSDALLLALDELGDGSTDLRSTVRPRCHHDPLPLKADEAVGPPRSGSAFPPSSPS